MSEINRVFLYGIDAATWDFILPHIEFLPNFKKLLEKSLWGNLESTIPPITPAAWTTMFSGIKPQKHGIFGFTVSEDPISIKPPRVSKEKIGYPLIWDIISSKGGYVVCSFIPFAYPPPKVKGLFISGMGTPSINSKFVYPTSRKEEILEFGVNPDIPHEELLENIDGMYSTYMENLKNSIELIKYLMEFEPWNLFIYVLEEIDRIQHVFWKFTDPNHPLYNVEGTKKYSSVILEFYKIADSFLGYLLSHLPPDAALIIASDHGMGSNYRRIVLNNWLYEKGYISITGKITKKESKVGPKLKKIVKKYGLYNVASRMYSAIFSKKISSIKRWNIDWRNTIAYSIHPFLIQINRKPCKYGFLEKREAIYYSEEIIQKLRKDELFGDVGYYTHNSERCIPDIFVKPKQPTDFIIPFSNKTINIIEPPINRGEHRMNGIYTIYYPSSIKIHKNANIVDVTPTILNLLGYPEEEYMDGRSIY